ncbi:hypothetical protein OIU91_37105 [Streptomyces sp. NBC_01456]|uniref:hypothetical protein n=1 Tax=unclassified Streptomyces TaxID=2593676 RepID=UPI002E2F2690|nr:MULTISPECIES: hypothetical protein [unclassified Streptomyces]
MSTVDDVPEAPAADAAPLSRWERLGASLAGTALAGAGVVAVFMTGNQAGSVALLLVGVILLIMAINGSPLTRARYQDYELLMSRRRHQIVASIEQEAPQDARQALQVLSAVDPRATDDPLVARVSALVYEREVFDHLARFYPDTRLVGGAEDFGIDVAVQTPSALIGVQIKVGRTVLTTSVLRNIIHAAARSSGRVPIDGLLVVTNRPLPQDVPRRLRQAASADLPTTVVRWVDEQDDAVLEAKVQELISRLGASG